MVIKKLIKLGNVNGMCTMCNKKEILINCTVRATNVDRLYAANVLTK